MNDDDRSSEPDSTTHRRGANGLILKPPKPVVDDFDDVEGLLAKGRSRCASATTSKSLEEAAQFFEAEFLRRKGS